MAKKLETQDVKLTDEGAPNPADSFISNWGEMLRSTQKAQSQQAVARNDRKRLLDQCGYRPDAVALLLRLWKMDPEDRNALLSQLFQGARWLEMSFATQMDLFSAQPNDEPSQKAKEQRAADDAEFSGWEACRAGEAISDNPHPVGSQHHQDWDRGFRACMLRIAEGGEVKGKRAAAKGAEPKPNKDRRGGADAEAKPSAAVVPMTAARQRGGKRQDAEAPAAEAAPEDSDPQEDDRDPRDVDPMETARAHANLINLGNTKH